ncbi:hypothetical protein BHE74_00002939 [Ensete ventricosum]|nr:hypothetical protein BHE74_00002939 [Ensete ventricosum]
MGTVTVSTPSAMAALACPALAFSGRRNPRRKQQPVRYTRCQVPDTAVLHVHLNLLLLQPREVGNDDVRLRCLLPFDEGGEERRGFAHESGRGAGEGEERGGAEGDAVEGMPQSTEMEPEALLRVGFDPEPRETSDAMGAVEMVASRRWGCLGTGKGEYIAKWEWVSGSFSRFLWEGERWGETD